MQKLIILNLILFNLFVYSQRKNNDTIRGMPDCTQYDIDQQVYFKNLTSESNEINYAELHKKIIENLAQGCIASKDLIVFLENIVDHFCPMDELMMCQDKVNTKNPNYNDINFWTPRTLKYLSKFLDKNIIPKKSHLAYTYKTYNINNENKYYRNHETYLYIISLSNELYLNENYHVVHNKEKTPVNLSITNSISVNFRNFLDRKVEVSIEYNQGKVTKTKQTLIFQYNNRNWDLIKAEFWDEN